MAKLKAELRRPEIQEHNACPVQAEFSDLFSFMFCESAPLLQGWVLSYARWPSQTAGSGF